MGIDEVLDLSLAAPKAHGRLSSIGIDPQRQGFIPRK
jgi:hypothetical protein